MSEEREYRKAKEYKLDPATNMPIVRSTAIVSIDVLGGH